MHIMPMKITFHPQEMLNKQNIIIFSRGCENSIHKQLWNFNADRISVYKLYNLIQVFGDWYEQGSDQKVLGVLNIRLSDKDMVKARSAQLTASEIVSLNWEDWFIYKMNGEKYDGKYSSNCSKTRRSTLRSI
ncbi:hypothetical protein ACTWP4_15575 [Gracilibacillus sp. D59]|uniref:hypothetical protein n=1 Tax=Gracilibacillus sp. D59 TaxID=3457434 RepID=UPI003FCCB98C